MMHGLEMPFSLSGLQIDTHQRLGEKVVAGPVPSVEIGRWCLDGQEYQPKLFIGGNAGPDAGVAIHGPRIVLPGLVAELTWAWDRVELPQWLPCPHVERARQSLRVVVRLDRQTLLERGPDKHDVFHHR